MTARPSAVSKTRRIGDLVWRTIAGPVSLAMEDRRGVEEEQRIEQRRLDVLAVAGRGALDQRGAGAEDGHQRGRHAGHGEGEPDRIVPGEQSLLCAGPGVHERLPARLVA